MTGCIRNVLAGVGCATLLAAGGLAAWHFRPQITDAVRSFKTPEVPADSAVTGWPSETALRSARRKEEAMENSRGPGVVTLTADEMAALITDGLDPGTLEILDSIRVVLSHGRLTLEAALMTGALGDDLLGPIAAMLQPYERLVVGGPARVFEPGTVFWEPDAFTVRSFSFPRVAVPRLVNRLARRTDGAIPIYIPSTVGDLRIRATGVTFYRQAQ